MSEYTVIADVSETFLKVLKDGMSGLVAPDHVTLASPADIELDTAPWLIASVYHVGENASLKNLPPTRLDERRFKPAPSTVDLMYLVVPYAQTRDNEYQVLGRAMQLLASKPVLRGSALQGALAGTDSQFEVTLHPVPLEEILRLWNTFSNRPFKVSVSYLVSGVRIDSMREPITTEPVLQRDIGVTTTL